jgi:hypothetical protein
MASCHAFSRADSDVASVVPIPELNIPYGFMSHPSLARWRAGNGGGASAFRRISSMRLVDVLTRDGQDWRCRCHKAATAPLEGRCATRE